MNLIGSQPAAGPNAREIAIGAGALPAVPPLWMIFGVWPAWFDGLLRRKRAFVSTTLNRVTLVRLCFLVVSGFTLVFGLMRNVNLARGSLYRRGAYVGREFAHRTGSSYVGVVAGVVVLAAVGVLMQVLVLQRPAGDQLRQTLVTIGLPVAPSDLTLPVWGGRPISSKLGRLRRAVAVTIVTALTANGRAVFLRFRFIGRSCSPPQWRSGCRCGLASTAPRWA